jgi:hypothetical protein
MHRKRLMIDAFDPDQRASSEPPDAMGVPRRIGLLPRLPICTPPRCRSSCVNKRLTMHERKSILGELERFAIARRPGLSEIPDLRARRPSQACPRPAVMLAALPTLAFNASRFASWIATICRTWDLVSSRRLPRPPRAADGGEILKLARSPTCARSLRFLHFTGRRSCIVSGL